MNRGHTRRARESAAAPPRRRAPPIQTPFAHTPLSLPPLFQVELTSGETYRGDMAETEDNWNVQLKNVTATAKVKERGEGDEKTRPALSAAALSAACSHSLSLSHLSLNL